MRIVRRVSQKTLADLTGIPVSTIRSYEYGRREPKIENENSIRRVLDTYPVVTEDMPNGYDGLTVPDIDKSDKPANIELATPNATMTWHGKTLQDAESHIIRTLAKLLVEQRK
jgi:transcriptional regulator with XRE-family HTH domain